MDQFADLIAEIEAQAVANDGNLDAELSDKIVTSLADADDETVMAFLRNMLVDIRARPAMTPMMKEFIRKASEILIADFFD